MRLPFCTAPVCLPVLFRLWAGKGTASPVDLAAELLTGRCVLVRDLGSTKVYELALFTTDTTSDVTVVVERCTVRWSCAVTG